MIESSSIKNILGKSVIIYQSLYYIVAQNTEDKREKIQALSLAKECYPMKMNLLTVVDAAIRFVSDRSKENLESVTEGDKEEAEEPDYDEEQDQLEEEQEEETGEITTATTNHVF